MDDSYAIATPHNEIFNKIYSELNRNGLPRIGASEAANFLKQSNLPMTTLGQIWELSDSSKVGSLDKRGAFVAFKLVAAAQQGKPIANTSLYDSSLFPPQFGAPVPPANLQHHFQPAFPSAGRAPPVPPPPQISSQQASPSHGNMMPSNWPINPNDQMKYDSIFQSLNPVNGKLSGANVRPVLMNSGLDAVSLARIWELSDIDKDGHLDRIEMSVALHLVYRTLQSEPIPAQLPASLIHPSKTMFAQQSPSYPPPVSRSQYGSRAGSVTSLDEVNITGSYAATIPRAANGPRAYSAQPQMSYNSGSATPITSQLPHSGSVNSLNASFGNSEWPVLTEDYASQFMQCDNNSDGLVDGQDVRSSFLATGLPAQSLAHIWSLVDFKKSGQLNLEQFSLAMHLVAMEKRGEAIPLELPPNLLPPSFREPTVSKTTVQSQNQSVSTPQLPEATSMEIKEALESENIEMKELAEAIQAMLTERKTAEENVIQLEADMNVKNSKIKNLQVELKTLESTVKQLERQKMEATRRLTDYDTQIEQLEAACKAQNEKKEETQKRINQIQEDAKNSEESKANDEKEIEELRKEIEQLDTQLSTIKGEVGKEKGEWEKTVSELTKLERRETRDNIQLERLSSEIEVVRSLTDQIVAAVEEGGEKMEEMLKSNAAILSSTVDNTLLSDDTVYGEASTSQQNNHIQQPPDPFAAAKTQPANDPFAQVDPFASQGQFAASFPSDPFAQGFPQEAPLAPAKPAPPRPAPPKSARATPVNDPFSPSQGATTEANFANFADFGAAFN